MGEDAGGKTAIRTRLEAATVLERRRGAQLDWRRSTSNARRRKQAVTDRATL
jgi:hypothetical protein